MGKGVGRRARMMRQIVVHVPDELFDLMGGSESQAATFLIRAFIMDLVRRKAISVLKASEILGIHQREMHALLNQYGIAQQS